ncbi:MAG: alpha/beta hydrolase, partial [Enterobacter hormaechei]|nr:alpha/beta hydrolase [Enterobacter hormaechei]
MLTRRLSCLALLMALASPAMAADAPTYGEKLEGFDYGWPVKHFT